MRWTDAEWFGGPRVDAVTLQVGGSARSLGFRAAESGREFRRVGWRAVEREDAEGALWTMATAERPALGGDGALWAWARGEHGHVSRMDVKVDGIRAPVTADLVDYFSGHRGRVGYDGSRAGRTVYIGSRRSPVMLRVYEIERDKAKVARLAEWERCGVPGAAPSVTRVEFELKGRGVAFGMEEVIECVVGRGAAAERALADGCARYVLRARPPGEYSQACKAPVDDGWHKLAVARREVRDRTPPPRERCAVDRAVAALRRLVPEGLDLGRLVAALADEHERAAEVDEVD